MLQRAARNAYSWWWASHVRTKQSKWLDQNLQDMEEKVEYILKIIDEDGDTFRQRAEMYYRKRPEIVNFVEDAFRGYRALAERYDHLSKELQSANRAIATVYPERVPFEMDENDDFDVGKFSAVALPSDESNMLSKNPPAAPKLNIPKIPNVSKKNSKAPTRLMSKKGLMKINAGDDAAPVPSSGLNKSEALQRIDKLQKDILSLQTEKEFVRSSYESGLEKFWDIEKWIIKMHREVSDLQDEFGIGMVIEDDEARTLMTASAIKSCQETLTRLKQKQEQAAEDARVESQKVQEAGEMFVKLKEKLTCNQADLQEHLEENELLSPNLEPNKLEQEEGCAEQTIHNLETPHRKIKEELQASLGNSLTMSELAEKVDEHVDEVISLENTVSSQNAYVKRFRSEVNELHVHIQSLEGEKGKLIDVSSSKSNKIRELEEELQRVQSINQCIEQQNSHLQTRFIESSCNLDDLSEKLLNVKLDEDNENVTSCTQTTNVLGVSPVKQIQLQEVKTANSVPEISKDFNTKEVEQKADLLEQNTCDDGEQKNLAQTISSYLQNHKVIVSSDTNRELGVPAMEVMITPGRSLVVSDGETVLQKVNREDIIDHSNSSKAESTNNDPSNRTKSQLNFTSEAVPNMKSEEWFGENKDKIVLGYDSMVMKDMVLQEQEKEHYLWDSSTSEKDNDKSLSQSSQRININHFHRSPVRATPECSASSERERGDVILSNQGNDLDNQLIKHQFEAGRSDASERGFKEQHNVTTPCDLSIERDMTAEAPKDNFVLSDRDNHNDIYSSKGQVGDLLDVNPEKSDKSRDSIVPAKSIEMKYEENKGEIPGLCTSTSAEESHSRFQRRHSGNGIGNSPTKGPGEAVLHDGSEGKSDESRDSIIPAEHVEMKDASKQSEILGHSNIKSADENNSKCKGNLSGQAVIDKNTGMEEKNDIYTNLSPVKPNCSSGHPSLFTQPNDLPVIDQVRSISETNQQQKGINRSENIADTGNIFTMSRDVERVENVKQNSLADQGIDHEPEKQNVLLTAPSEVNIDELGLEEDDQPNWRELFLNGLDDREKILLQEYTSILRNYKEARKKLNEVEKKKRASLFQYCIQIKVLRSANAVKDAEIQSLQKKLNLSQKNQDETAESKERETIVTSFHVSGDQSLNRDKNGLQDLSGEATHESTDTTEESSVLEQPKISDVEEDEGIKVINLDESPNFSIIEEKIRTDIDELLEENIEFWMRFSTSFHQIEKFQTMVRDLQAEIAKLKEKKQKGRITNHQSVSSDICPIYRHLTEIQTELALWLDHNVVIKDDLENRLSSLSSMQEEITRLSNAGSKEEIIELDNCQAAKFQGEVLNMKQENKKVAHELQSGLERVKNLQVEIEKTLKELDDEFDVSVKSQQSRYTAVRSRIPLRSFLFGVKLKKQKKPSFLACISPALQKQHRHLTDSPT